MAKQLDKLPKDNAIEHIDSTEGASTTVVVWKPNGTIRLCIDLRGPNQEVVVDSFPTPHIDELMNFLQGAT